MCDCEELEFEDFEVMLSAISRKSGVPVVVPVEAPLIRVAATPKRSK